MAQTEHSDLSYEPDDDNVFYEGDQQPSKTEHQTLRTVAGVTMLRKWHEVINPRPIGIDVVAVKFMNRQKQKNLLIETEQKFIAGELKSSIQLLSDINGEFREVEGGKKLIDALQVLVNKLDDQLRFLKLERAATQQTIEEAFNLMNVATEEKTRLVLTNFGASLYRWLDNEFENRELFTQSFTTHVQRYADDVLSKLQADVGARHAILDGCLLGFRGCKITFSIVFDELWQNVMKWSSLQLCDFSLAMEHDYCPILSKLTHYKDKCELKRRRNNKMPF